MNRPWLSRRVSTRAPPLPVRPVAPGCRPPRASPPRRPSGRGPAGRAPERSARSPRDSVQPGQRGHGQDRRYQGAPPPAPRPAFTAEREWRLISRPVSLEPFGSSPTAVKVRDGRGLPRIYQEIPIGHSDKKMWPFSQVVCGPSPHSRELRASVAQDAFVAAGKPIPWWGVGASAIPHRSW